jgi:transposase-like protein
MATTKCGISAKQLERELGVTYKCAWRIFTKIRSMMNEDVMNLLGEVEADESFFGGSDLNRHVGKRRGYKGKYSGKTTVFGMIERHGRVIAAVVPTPVSSSDLLPRIKAKVMPKSVIFTDEARFYENLPLMGYSHERVHHSANVYVDGSASTNTMESWSLVKRGIDGVHHNVSAKYLHDYLNAYAFRWNHRDEAKPMFFQIAERIPTASEPVKQAE